jgi:hypothetical protein
MAQIGAGITLGPGITAAKPEPRLMLSLDAATYSGSGDWIDSVGNKHFVLNNNPTYDAVTGGGSFVFDSNSAQWANCDTSLPSLTTWTVEVWHYYTGVLVGPNDGQCAAIITETYPNVSSCINYSLGNNAGDNPSTNLYAGYFNPNPYFWTNTSPAYTLTPNNWYQITGTFDGSNLRLYVNGEIATAINITGAPTPQSGGAGIRLMRRRDNADYWGGSLATVNIWNGDIGADAVLARYNANKGRFGL